MAPANSRHDIAIVGAGIAGASLAAELAADARVLLLEAEERPGLHATGRSAAFWAETYGGPQVQPLTSASRAALAAGGWLGPRGALHIARDGQQGLLETMAEAFAACGARLHHLGRAELTERLPHLREGWVAALEEPDCRDIDVAGLHQACLARARRAGATLLTRAELTGAQHEPEGWRLTTRAGEFRAAVLVDAAGAWADRVAQRAGARPLGLRPLRRTIAQLRVAPPAGADLPLVLAADESLYFKPEAGGRLWLSPADESPSEPVDAAPEELDVALAIDRFQAMVDWPIEAVERRWAGLRSFAPDRLPLIGWDRELPGFFWFAGQGGFGIQTAPAAAQLAAALLTGRTPAPEVAAIDPSPYAPARFG